MQLFHRDLGGEGKPPLVVLHGLLGSSRNWLTTGADLATVRHVLAPDLRNHGSSPHAPEHTYAAMEADVLAWLGGLGIERFDLIGHSMGGKVAMHIACNNPGRVTSLIAVDIAPRSYRLDSHTPEFTAMNALHPETLNSRQEAEDAFLAAVGDLGTAKFLATNLDRREEGGFKWKINLPVLTASVATLGQSPLAPTDRYDGPALFIAGEESGYVRDMDGDPIAAHFPNATIHRIPGAGHNPHIDSRAAFVEAVRGFLESDSLPG
ncbi:MAG TPA: alpha/beta fold hydrolase [Opitutaceae bacterium]|nr:alpha/beta fold hydrolase [Opitutaceae bacterium]